MSEEQTNETKKPLQEQTPTEPSKSASVVIETDQTENNGDKTSGKSAGKKWAIIAGIVVALIADIIIGIGIYNAPATRIAKHLSLGNRYLEEQNYKQAIVEFNEVIRIDPMFVDAYLGKAQAYESMGDIDMAIQVLERGYEITGDDEILDVLEEMEKTKNKENIGNADILEANTEDISNADILEPDIEDVPTNMPGNVSEEELRRKLEENVSEPVVGFMYDDFDYNGTYEAIVLCGEEYLDEQSGESYGYYGTLYFVTEEEIQVIRTADDYWNSGEVFDFGDAKIFCINKYYTTGAVSYLYQVEGDKAIEIAGSGRGNYFSREKEGWISMTDSQYDATIDGMGHTWNVYYFYWDHGLHEYGGTQISLDAFSAYAGADAIVKKIADDGYTIGSIYRRQNGIVNINCSDGYSNANVRLFLENGKVEVMPLYEGDIYDAGIIKPALIPEIATYSG